MPIPRSLPASALARFTTLVTVATLSAPATAAAQATTAAQSPPATAALASWTAVDMATGYETLLAPPLAAEMAGWQADHWGNLVRTVGSGAPERVIACGLDRPSYAVSRITGDGYLRLHRIGGGSRHPLWDQAYEAQQVRILTAAGPVAGVVARSNGHFAQQHRDQTALVRADDLWVDVGARSADEVSRLGIELLDPVARHLPPWPVEDGVVAPDAGGRAACAAVVSVAEAAADAPPAGRTRFVLSAQAEMGWVGLGSLLARGPTVDALAVVGPGAAESEDATVDADDLGRVSDVIRSAGVARVRWIAPRVDAPGAPSEWITRDEVERVRAAVADAAGVAADRAVWVGAPSPAPLRSPLAQSGVDALATTLTDLVELHAVAGHEASVRRYVLDHLPAWAREGAQVDALGNVIVAAGPERDTTVFMAHMDEVGYEVTAVAPDGTVSLRTRGGAVSSAWEGQTAMAWPDAPGSVVDFDQAPADGSSADMRARARTDLARSDPPAPVRGRFSVRSRPEEKDPDRLTAHFGMDARALAARGVAVGTPVTSHKEGLRLGATRYTARALDDRAGTTALLEAVRRIDPERLPSKVIFTWSVGEEGGLVGAGHLAERFGATARRIYSVDTFVSSDTPLESDHFAYAPLGEGPVIRSIENSSVSPPAERRRTLDAAREAGIPVQLGLTQGGTDGTRFTFWGAPNQGLSWPGRYSHSPGEVLDLLDLARLSDLIVAVARTPG